MNTEQDDLEPGAQDEQWQGPAEQMAMAIKALLFDRTQLVDLDAESLAFDVVDLIANKGWRPPPTGDVIEQATHVLARVFAELIGDNPQEAFEAYWRTKAQKLADAGLLRAPVEQDEPKFHIVGTWLTREVDGCTCGAGVAPDPHEPGCGLEPEVDLSTVSGWPELQRTAHSPQVSISPGHQAMPIPVPPPDELVDAERRVRDRIIDKGWGACAVAASDIKEVLHLLDQARAALRAALRAAGEGQDG